MMCQVTLFAHLSPDEFALEVIMGSRAPEKPENRFGVISCEFLLRNFLLFAHATYFRKTRLAHGLIKGQFRCFAFARLSQTNLNNLFFQNFMSLNKQTHPNQG